MYTPNSPELLAMVYHVPLNALLNIGLLFSSKIIPFIHADQPILRLYPLFLANLKIKPGAVEKCGVFGRLRLYPPPPSIFCHLQNGEGIT